MNEQQPLPLPMPAPGRYCVNCAHFAYIGRQPPHNAHNSRTPPRCTRTVHTVDWVYGTRKMNLCSEERAIRSEDRCESTGRFFVSQYQGEDREDENM